MNTTNSLRRNYAKLDTALDKLESVLREAYSPCDDLELTDEETEQLLEVKRITTELFNSLYEKNEEILKNS